MSTFILAKHNAHRAGLHYDLYLEDGGRFLAYSIPKGLPTTRGTKHLAIRVNDHSLPEAMFEGEIPPGQYGAGTKEIVDEGVYWEPALGIIELHGGSINGQFHLKHWEGNKYLIWHV